MPSGGARNRSGPAPSDESGRSDRLRRQYLTLPAAGYAGRIPRWPLPDPTDRERQVWRQLWRTPQAHGWAMPDQDWRTPVVALYVRTRVRCEEPDAPASLLAQLHRFADQIGLTTAGLAELGWKIAADELTARREAPTPEPPAAPKPQPRRMRAVPDDGG